RRWTTSLYVKLSLPPRQSRGASLGGLGNLTSICRPLICVRIVINECCLKSSKRLLSLKNIPSDVEIVALSIRDVFALMTSRVDGACGTLRFQRGALSWDITSDVQTSSHSDPGSEQTPAFRCHQFATITYFVAGACGLSHDPRRLEGRRD